MHCFDVDGLGTCSCLVFVILKLKVNFDVTVMKLLAMLLFQLVSIFYLFNYK